MNPTINDSPERVCPMADMIQPDTPNELTSNRID